MADVMMELNGVRKRVPADRVEHFKGKGARVVDDAPKPAPAPAPEPSMWEQAREGVKGLASGAVDLAKRASQMQQDAGAAALRGASLGLDDEIAALAARAGATVQRQRDSDAMVGAGGGEGLLESWRATAPLGDEARQERRAEVDAAKARSTIAAGVGELGGALATGLAAPGAQGGRLAQILSGAGTGAIAGAGMGDAATAEDIAADAALGGALGAAAGALPAVAGAGKRALAGVRARPPAPAPAAPSVPLRQRAADVLEEVADKGPVEALRKRVVGAAAEAVRGAPPPPAAPTRSAYEQALDEQMALMSDPAALRRATETIAKQAPPAPAAVAGEPIMLVTPKAPRASLVPAIDEAEIVGPEEVKRAVTEIGERAMPVPPPPSPARGTSGEILTDLRRSVLGRRPTFAEVRDAVQEVAIREGTTDLATLSSKIGAPTTQIREALVPMLREAKFREAVAAAAKPTAPAVSTLDEQMTMGRTMREAGESARSPIDNVSGRPANQVAAVQQQERWRAAYDALPTEQRAAFIEQLRRESGLPDDAIRQRLKLTKAEWRRTSFTRSQARQPGPPTESPPGPRPPISR